MRKALAVGLLGVSVLTACGETIDSCLQPPAGSRADVTLAFEDTTGFTVAECPNPSSDFAGAFVVKGTASQRLFEDRTPDDLSLASDFDLLVVSGAVRGTPSYHQSSVTGLRLDCDDTADLSHIVAIVFVSDWADVDASIGKIGHALNEASLGETVIVAVAPPFCPD